jgi:hypothetical protein
MKKKNNGIIIKDYIDLHCVKHCFTIEANALLIGMFVAFKHISWQAMRIQFFLVFLFISTFCILGLMFIDLTHLCRRFEVIKLHADGRKKTFVANKKESVDISLRNFFFQI